MASSRWMMPDWAGIRQAGEYGRVELWRFEEVWFSLMDKFVLC